MLLFLLILPLISGQDFKSDCFNKNTEEFIVFKDTFDFNDAQNLCISSGGNLARIETLDEFNFAINFFNSQEIEDIFVWIGLTRKVDLEDPKASDFFFVDGNSNITFYEFGGSLPWDENNPNDVDGDQDCVTWSLHPTPTFGVEPLRWNDERCALNLNSVLCRRECTTLAPTSSPTRNPTVNPTKSPSFFPTIKPTVSPTKNPTKSPTVSPTNNPTRPTISPSAAPTEETTETEAKIVTLTVFIGAGLPMLLMLAVAVYIHSKVYKKYSHIARFESLESKLANLPSWKE